MSPTIEAALRAAAGRLDMAGVPDPLRDARVLMADALGVPASGLTPILRDPLDPAAAAAFEAHVAARLERRPVAQILGRREFWGRTFAVTPEVLDPRPETETLVALALEDPPPARLLDLGVGSGAILVTLLAEWPTARGVGVDLSAEALAVAVANAARNGVSERASFRRADWTEGLAGQFDLVVSNPPYIPLGEISGLAPEVRDWEPHLALTPGPRGLESYARIAARLGSVLAPGGRGLFEIGADQGDAVTAIFADAGFADATRHRDLDGRDRVVAVRAAAAA